MVAPEFPGYQDIDTGWILGKAHYVFRSHIDEKGRLEYQYDCRLPKIEPRKVERECHDLAADAAKRDGVSGSPPKCGPFYLNLYVWDRSKELLDEVQMPRDLLDAHCGVSVFRDGRHVLPYGEPGDDWLQLDRERINDPSHRIGNNQVIGYVEIGQNENLELREKTNRERLTDNDAFGDLRVLVRAAISVFTMEW